MLNAVDENHLCILEDFIHDPVVASSSRPETFELAKEWLSEACRVLGYWSEDRRQGGIAYLRWESVQMPDTLGGDLDFVHPAPSNPSDLVSKR